MTCIIAALLYIFSISDLKYVKVAVIFNGQTNLTYCCELDEYSSGQCETDTTVWPGEEAVLVCKIFYWSHVVTCMPI